MAMNTMKRPCKTKPWIRSVRWFAIVLMVITGTILFVVIPYRQHHQIQASIQALVTKYGLFIRYKDPSQFHIPPLEAIDASKDSYISFEKVDERMVPQALEGVKDALSHYPVTLVKEYLSAVFIAGKIRIYNVEGAATFANSWIYIAAPRYDGLGALSYALSVHHEFSTLLFHKAKFPLIHWHLVNSPDFKYLDKHEDIIDAANLENRKDDQSAVEWHKAGFVSDYGMSSMANDFGTYAEMAFGEPEKLRQLSMKYLPIKRKTDLLVKFYTDLAPGMCDYFISVGLVPNCPEQSN